MTLFDRLKVKAVVADIQLFGKTFEVRFAGSDLIVKGVSFDEAMAVLEAAANGEGRVTTPPVQLDGEPVATATKTASTSAPKKRSRQRSNDTPAADVSASKSVSHTASVSNDAETSTSAEHTRTAGKAPETPQSEAGDVSNAVNTPTSEPQGSKVVAQVTTSPKSAQTGSASAPRDMTSDTPQEALSNAESEPVSTTTPPATNGASLETAIAAMAGESRLLSALDKLVESGVSDAAKIMDVCLKVKDQVPVLARITSSDFEERIGRAVELLAPGEAR